MFLGCYWYFSEYIFLIVCILHFVSFSLLFGFQLKPKSNSLEISQSNMYLKQGAHTQPWPNWFYNPRLYFWIFDLFGFCSFVRKVYLAIKLQCLFENGCNESLTIYLFHKLSQRIRLLMTFDGTTKSFYIVKNFPNSRDIADTR